MTPFEYQQRVLSELRGDGKTAQRPPSYEEQSAKLAQLTQQMQTGGLRHDD